MKHKLDYYKIFGFSLIPINIILIILLGLDFFGILPAYWSSIYVFYVFLIVNTTFLALRINKMHEDERENDYTVYLSKYLFLLGLVVLAVNQFLQRVIIIQYMNYIIGAIITVGFLTFFASKNRVEKEIEDENITEERDEERRKREFEYKFPRINKIWGLRSIVKWMYREGWGYVFGLVIIVIYGALLIFPNLGLYNIYHDEQWHISVIESLRHGEGHRLWNWISEKPMMYVFDGRIVNYGGYFITELFGYNNFNLRLIPAIFGLLNIILIYFVFKRMIGKVPALITSFGFAVNINALYLARFLRPYSSSLFFYLVTFYFFHKLITEFSTEEVSFKKRIVYSLIALISLIISIEERELGKILLILIPFTLIFNLVFNKNSWKMIRKKYTYFLTMFISILIILYFINLFKIINLEILFAQAKDYLSIDKLINPTRVYYYYLFEQYIKIPLLFYCLYVLGLFVLFFKELKHKQGNYSLLIVFSIVPLLIMIYILNRYDDPRYIYFLIPFIYSVSIMGTYYFSYLFFSKNSIFQKILFFTIIFSLIFYLVLPYNNINFLSFKSPSEWKNDDARMNWHPRGVPPEYSKVFSYLNSIQKPGDTLIILEGEWNIKPKEGVNYYWLHPFKYSTTLYDLRSLERTTWFDQNVNETDFYQVVSNTSDNKNIYFVGPYYLMLGKGIPEYLLNNCQDLAPSLGVLQYEMWSYDYNGKFYWPSFFVCNSTTKQNI